MKRYGIPLIVLVAGTFLLKLFRSIAVFDGKDMALYVLTALFLFTFGVYLNGYKPKKNDSWIKKVLIIACVVILMLMQMNIFTIYAVSSLLSSVGATQVTYYLLYIYFGYIFF